MDGCCFGSLFVCSHVGRRKRGNEKRQLVGLICAPWCQANHTFLGQTRLMGREEIKNGFVLTISIFTISRLHLNWVMHLKQTREKFIILLKHNRRCYSQRHQILLHDSIVKTMEYNSLEDKRLNEDSYLIKSTHKIMQICVTLRPLNSPSVRV